MHLLDAFLHELKILFDAPGGCHGSGIAFQPPADFQKVADGGPLAFHHGAQDAPLTGSRRAHEGSLALLLLQQPHDHQLVDGVSYRGAADAEGFGQFTLCENFFTGFEFTTKDQLPELVEHLVGNSFGFDGLELV